MHVCDLCACSPTQNSGEKRKKYSRTIATNMRVYQVGSRGLQCYIQGFKFVGCSTDALAGPPGHWHLNILMVSFRIILIIEVAAVVMSLQVATDSELNHD